MHVRGIIRRGLRLESVAGLSIALALPTACFAARGLSAQTQATQTTLTAETRDQAGRTIANLAVAVVGDDGLPATGAVSFTDNGHPLAGAALDNQGHATIDLGLTAGQHSLAATYVGDAGHTSSVSPSTSVQGDATTTPGFAISIAPTSLSLTPGQSGTITTSITPQNASALTAPMFVTLSCSGLPNEATCVFNPENLEILPTTTAAITSSMVVVTQEQSYAPIRGLHDNRVALAILFPGALALGGLAFSLRRHAWLQRLSLLALVALVSLLGTTACNARYDYYNHGPPPNPPTPAGTYTIKVTGQSSDGVNATTLSTSLVLTVQ